ncbi:MAG: hypothetical protein NTX56_05945, partial [Proteobacteria bacterium]|nr:hypothetical protein [Pseudomonadota bacterium]
LSTKSVDKLVDWQGRNLLNRYPASLFSTSPQNEAFVTHHINQWLICDTRMLHGFRRGAEKYPGRVGDSATIGTRIFALVNSFQATAHGH